MIDPIVPLAFSHRVRLTSKPERFDLLEISILDVKDQVLSATAIETDVVILPSKILVADDGQAFIVLADGYYDEWYEWWCLAYEVSAEGKLREIFREDRGRHGNYVRCTATWTSTATAVVKWEDLSWDGSTESTQEKTIFRNLGTERVDQPRPH
jgi:hypothetical protein